MRGHGAATNLDVLLIATGALGVLVAACLTNQASARTRAAARAGSSACSSGPRCSTLCLFYCHLGWPDALSLGRFGPVGVSAVFYLTLEAEERGLSETGIGAGIMVAVVSTVVHGVTSSAGRALYRRLTAETPTGQPVLEG
jgi:hypothetical protein